MSTQTPTNETPSPAIIRATIQKIGGKYFNLTPEAFPEISLAYELAVILKFSSHEEARMIKSKSAYIALYEQSKAPGSNFSIEGLYSLPGLRSFWVTKPLEMLVRPGNASLN